MDTLLSDNSALHYDAFNHRCIPAFTYSRSEPISNDDELLLVGILTTPPMSQSWRGSGHWADPLSAFEHLSIITIIIIDMPIWHHRQLQDHLVSSDLFICLPRCMIMARLYSYYTRSSMANPAARAAAVIILNNRFDACSDMQFWSPFTLHELNNDCRLSHVLFFG